MASLRWWTVAWPGLCVTVTAVGFARFAYTPIIPFLIGAGEVTPAQAGYLGAGNLAGYLLGALIASPLADRLGGSSSIRGGFVLTTLSLAACILPGGFWWLLPWRALAGLTGGVLMVLGPSFVLARTVPAERGRTGGVIYTGVGLGTGLGTLVVGPLGSLGPAWAWGGLALGSALATLLSWRSWQGAMTLGRPAASIQPRHPMTHPILLGCLAFGMDGAGIVPHSIFWVDFVARQLQLGTLTANFQWLLFALGAAIGPFLAGLGGDRIGLGRALFLVFAVKTAAVALPAGFTAAPLLALSAMVVGALTSAIPALLSARFAEIVPPHDQARVWGLATLVFSLTLAGGAYGFAFAYERVGHYQPLFLAAAICEAVGALSALAALREHPGDKER